MGGQELDGYGLGDTTLRASQVLDATVHVADRVAAQHPDTPRAGVELLELLQALGLPTTKKRRRQLEARRVIEQSSRIASKEQQ
jgi:hypothetical protein